MSNNNTKRRTQAERRAESRQAVLDSACRLFGEKGYTGTSLEDIAGDCGLTIRPIYHYFGNKKALFAAVNQVMEQRIVGSLDNSLVEQDDDILDYWRAFLQLCGDSGFRQIVLVDSPNILGRERWSGSKVSEKARALLGQPEQGGVANQYRKLLFSRVLMGAFTEAALMVAETEDTEMASREAELLMVALFSRQNVFLSGNAESAPDRP